MKRFGTIWHWIPLGLILALLLALPVLAGGGAGVAGSDRTTSLRDDRATDSETEERAMNAILPGTAILPDRGKLPTLGGRQLWADRYYHAGWRIQRHVWTRHHRLLDPQDRRRAWGSFAETRAAFEAFRSQQAVRANRPHLVVLLHGMGRTRHMFPALEAALTAEGYEVAALAYPSTRQDLAAHAADLDALLSGLEGVERVSFVTHSLGGIVLRRYLADRDAAAPGGQPALHRAVLVAAPNHGAALARMLEEVPAYRLLAGPAGGEITPAMLESLPVPAIPFALVAGVSGDGEGYNPLLPGEDDLVVGLEEALLPGAARVLEVREIHTFIADNPATIALVRDFLGGSR